MLQIRRTANNEILKLFIIAGWQLPKHNCNLQWITCILFYAYRYTAPPIHTHSGGFRDGGWGREGGG